MKFKVGDKVKVKSSGVEHWIWAIQGERKPIYSLLDEPGWFEEDELEPIEDPFAKKVEERNNKPEKIDNPIQPDHYNKGEIDLYEAWSKIYPMNEFRAGMEMIAMRYMFRDKEDKVQDLDKAIYTLERLKEYEEEK